MGGRLGRGLLALAGLAAGGAATFLGLWTGRSNPLGWVLIFFGLGYFLGGAFYLALTSAPARARREPGDRSLWLLAPGFLAVVFGAPLEYLLRPLLPFGPAAPRIGLGLMGAGLLLRLWVRLALGRSYTGHLQVTHTQPLVQAGPYRYIRHPGYLGFILMALGFALGYSSLLALLAVPVLLLPGLAYRMHAEERLLLEQFGEAYRDYARRTRRLVPGVW